MSGTNNGVRPAPRPLVDPDDLDAQAEALAYTVAHSDPLAAEKAADDAALRGLARTLGTVEGAKAELRLRSTRQAQLRIASEGAPPLEVLSAGTFLDGDDLEHLVPGMIYPDSLSRIVGAPGATKSFFALTMALCIATGTRWFGKVIPRARVHYVMAEGAAVNRARVRAWLAANEVDGAALDGWFHVVPHAVMLTPEGVEQLCARLRADGGSAMIILDTKNRMMVGNENDASDTAVMIRALDDLRTASGGAAVVLVDHSGLGDDTRARGSNAAFAAMDSEILVRTSNGVSTAAVVRDKGGETGYQLTYSLRTPRGHRHPVIVAASGPVGPADDSTEVLSRGQRYDRDTALMERVARYLTRQDEGAYTRAIRSEVTGNNAAVDRAIAALLREGYVSQEMHTNRGKFYRLLVMFEERTDLGPPEAPRLPADGVDSDAVYASLNDESGA